MPHLLALGPTPEQSWQYLIPRRGCLKIGRKEGNDCHVPWDMQISREHASLTWDNGSVSVECLDRARNPIIYHGRSYKSVKLPVGDEFQIGETRFRVIDEDVDSGIQRILDAPDPCHRTSTQYALRAIDHRIDKIAEHSATLWLSRDEQELANHLVAVVSEVIPHASHVAIVECASVRHVDRNQVKVLHWDSREISNEMSLSRPMLKAALKRGKSVLSIRSEDALANRCGRWVLCAPVISEHAATWCIYIAGRYGDDAPLPGCLTTEDLHGDVSFTELIAQTAIAIRKVRALEDQFAGIRPFFSPAVVESVAIGNRSNALDPTESQTAVLFCDLRDSTAIAEESRGNLKGLLHRVSKALDAMTQSIFRYDGVIADFQGDSALGFWGWPLPLHEGPLPACRAALRIVETFRRARRPDLDSELSGFQVGIGISCGSAIAGKIGSQHQAKVGVFGPVVNLGSRLEGLTKQIGVPILVDETT
ncbi:MAG: adenylate/guanylate cyclase domain-containing protein, partial [Planctomycetota bacterium]|nr:adenylate/guanylate cyclase domain-containing protein [Planctomycetota bacterium]